MPPSRTFDRIDWPRRTPRLVLRPALPSDLPVLFAVRSLPEIAEWEPSRPQNYEEFVLRQGKTDALDRCLVLELDGQVIGDLFLRVTDAWAQAEVREHATDAEAEIGWSLAPEHQGHGFATEAAHELLRICFDELGVRRITAESFADNEASLRVMDRLGMRREGLFVRESLHRDRGWVDSVVYGLLLEEWRAAHSG